MVKFIESKGESIDAAIENALTTLGMDRDSVSVEIVQKAKNGFLGIGKEPAIVKVSYESSPAEKAAKFLEGLLYRFGTPAALDTSEDYATKTITIRLSGDKMGAVIGRRGDTLDAMQYLTSIVANREEEERWRIVVDTENYRARRESTLEEHAQKTAQKALKYKKPVALEPMPPHERRIIHAALQNIDGITTYSTGSEPLRKVIVTAAGNLPAGQQPSQPKRGTGNNYNNKRRRRRPPNQGQAKSVSTEE